MSGNPWVRFFPSDWLAGTRGLTCAETGIYISLVAMMYERGGKIKDEPARLARMCGASNSVFKKALETLIAERKIVSDSGYLSNNRVVEELSYSLEKSEVARAAAKSRWAQKPNENKGGDDAGAMQTQCDGNANQKPEARSQKDKSSLRSDARGRRFENAGIEALPDDWRQFANSLGLDPDRVWLAFTDYWRSVAGAKGRKADWSATWRSWCRREAENGKAIAKPTASAAAPRIETFDDREARERARLEAGVTALKAGQPPPPGWSRLDTSRAFSRGMIDAAMAERAGLRIEIRTPAQQAGAE